MAPGNHLHHHRAGSRASSRAGLVAEMKFGKRTVVSEAYLKGTRLVYDCVCECGSKDAVRATDLKKGISTACRECTFSPLSNIERFTKKWKAHPHRSLPGKGPCWEWLAGKSSKRTASGTTVYSYGTFFLEGRARRAHCVSYEHYIGPVPEGLELDHLCKFKICVNPLHLEAVTHKENVNRCGSLAGAKASSEARAAATHCNSGLHKWTEETTRTDKRGQRACRPCERSRKRRYRARKTVAGG